MNHDYDCQCDHPQSVHDGLNGECMGYVKGHLDCPCLTFSIHWADKPICQCGHESHEHVAPSDPFIHSICNGEWSDQGMPIPCCCIKYVETTQAKMWEEQKKETRPVFKERESWWQRMIKFLF